MRKNVLYTVRKSNMPAFMQRKNLFDSGSSLINPYANDFNNSRGYSFTQNMNKQNGIEYQNYLNKANNTTAKTGTQIGDTASGSNWSKVGSTAASVASMIPATEMTIGDQTYKRGMWDALDPVYYAAEGRESDIGNTLSDTGVTLTQAGLSTGNYWLALAGAGAKIAGSAANYMFGTKTDESTEGAIKGASSALENYNSNAQSFDDLRQVEVPIGYEDVYEGPDSTASTVADVLDFFSFGLLGLGKKSRKAREEVERKNRELKERYDAAMAWANSTYDNNLNNLKSDQLANALANYSAFGGSLYGNGGGIHIKPSHRGRLTELKERTGKSEAELYNDGNPAHKKMVVFARNARKWKHDFGGPMNYYSGALGLMQNDKYLDAINKRSDAIGSRGGLFGGYTFGSEPKNTMAFGGELGTNGTDFSNGLLEVNTGSTHENNPIEGVPMGMDAQGTPNLVEEGETVFNDYVFSNRLKVPKDIQKDLGLGNKKQDITFADASKKLAKESEQRPNDPISIDGLEASMSRLMIVQEAERMKKEAKKMKGLEEYACGGKLGKKLEGPGRFPNWLSLNNDLQEKYPWLNLDTPDNDTYYGLDLPDVDIVENATSQPSGLNLPPVAVNVPKTLPTDNLPQQPKPRNPYLDEDYLNREKSPRTYQTWMRYAPAVGNGILALTDALGLTNKPDYTYADKLEEAAINAGYAPKVEATPIGDYLTYRPMDIWAEQNRLDANARAAERAIMNSNNPARYAALLAQNYNNQIASGDLYRKSLEYNEARRQAVADFNRRTNMYNSQMGLEAAMANAGYKQRANKDYMQGLAQAAAFRDAIDQRVGASRSANITNFLNSLGDIGRENFAFNQLNTDKSRRYTTNRSGEAGYRACGGKLKKK